MSASGYKRTFRGVRRRVRLDPRKRTFNLQNLVKASSLKLIPRIVHSTLLGLFGPTWAAHSGFLFFRGLRGLGLLIALRGGRGRLGDLDVTIETAMGAEEKFPYLFCPTRGKRILMGKVYQSFGTGNRWRPIVDRFGCGASFFGIMRLNFSTRSQDPNPPVWILRWRSLGRGLISAHQMPMDAGLIIASSNVCFQG